MTKRQTWAVIVASLLLGTIIAAALLVLVNLWIDEAKCEAYSETTGRSVKYVKLVGCMVNTQVGWVPREEFRQVLRVDAPK